MIQCVSEHFLTVSLFWAPDHGTAFDIAGKNEASANSMRQAIYMAIDIYRNRKSDAEAHRNPLRKLYFEKRDDSDKLKLE